MGLEPLGVGRFISAGDNVSQEFEIGSTVATKLGGPLMMVREFSPQKSGDTSFLCFWFDYGLGYQSEWFDGSLLIPADGARKAGFGQ